MNVHDTIINGTDLGGKHVFPHIKTLFVYFYNEKKHHISFCYKIAFGTTFKGKYEARKDTQ